MIKVTNEMLQVARSMKSFESMIERIIELHEQSKPIPLPQYKPDKRQKAMHQYVCVDDKKAFTGNVGADTEFVYYCIYSKREQKVGPVTSQAKPKPEPVKPDVYSNDGGEYWVQHPADCDIFSDWDDEPKVGDEYELQVCWTGKQKFRITEVGDGSVEKVELIDSNTTYYTTPPTREPYTGERVICAAVMLNDKLYCGYRHANIYNQCFGTYLNGIEGFITTDNGRFVDRKEAWLIADKAGQIINRGEGIDGLLFSENLY